MLQQSDTFAKCEENFINDVKNLCLLQTKKMCKCQLSNELVIAFSVKNVV